MNSEELLAFIGRLVIDNETLRKQIAKLAEEIKELKKPKE